jgi:hypothetical protein
MAYVVVRRDRVPNHAYFPTHVDTITEHVSDQIPLPGGRSWPGLVFAPSAGPAFGQPSLFDTGDCLTHVGKVGGKTGHKSATSGRTFRIEDLRAIDPPVPVDQILEVLEIDRRVELQAAYSARGGFLSRPTTLAVIDAVRRLRPDSAAVLGWLSAIGAADRFIEGPAGTRWALDRDKVGIAKRLGGFSPSQSWQRPAGDDDPYTAGLFEMRGNPTEVSIMEHDSRIIPGFHEALGSAAGRADVHVFFSDRPDRFGRHRVMQVLNVNATGDETWSGGDLIYYHVSTGSCLVVQYKVLTESKRLGREGEHVLVDQPMREQIAKLHNLSSASLAPGHPHEWRLGPDCGFLKLAAFDGRMDPDDSGMVRGMYLPASYAQLMLDTGHKTLGYDTAGRYFDNTRFIDLVKEGWLGTSGVTINELKEYCKYVLANGGSLLAAVDHSPGGERERVKQSRDRTPNHKPARK